MDLLTYIGIFLLIWGVMVLGVAFFKPKAIWKLGKIQGFVQLFGEVGTTIFFSVVGAAAAVGGVLILI